MSFLVSLRLAVHCLSFCVTLQPHMMELGHNFHLVRMGVVKMCLLPYCSNGIQTNQTKAQ